MKDDIGPHASFIKVVSLNSHLQQPTLPCAPVEKTEPGWNVEKKQFS